MYLTSQGTSPQEKTLADLVAKHTFFIKDSILDAVFYKRERGESAQGLPAFFRGYSSGLAFFVKGDCSVLRVDKLVHELLLTYGAVTSEFDNSRVVQTPVPEVDVAGGAWFIRSMS